jgi:uncharacterized Ntn-hydrolase superfamily protein
MLTINTKTVYEYPGIGINSGTGVQSGAHERGQVDRKPEKPALPGKDSYFRTIVILSSLIIFSLSVTSVQAQDTFSIVAADSVTRETGSAGASCVDLFQAGYADASFLGDLLPDTGAINTQASYLPANQNNARARMRAGDTPGQIIDWLTAHDAASNPAIRQYGIVGFTGANVSSAGFTGAGCTNYKNHQTGSIDGIYYAIQGNILLGQVVLDSMEARFRRADGDLACRLMAALQGAKMVGADTRCSSNGTSTLFAFIKVAQPTNTYGHPSFLVSVKTHNNAHIEPIDSLQVLFNLQHTCSSSGVTDKTADQYLNVYPNPSEDEIAIQVDPSLAGSGFTITDLYGRIVLTGKLRSETVTVDIQQLSAGIYFIRVKDYYRKCFIKK